MAKLFTGNISFSQAFQPTGRQPLDVRTVVEKYSDLISRDTWVADNVVAVYKGMTVAVVENKQVYMLIDADHVEKTASWVVVGSQINGGIDINSALEAQSAATDTLRSDIEEALGYDYKSGDTVADAITAANDRIDAINEALGLGDGETTGETILDRVETLESGVTATNERIDNLKANEVAYEPENVVLSATTNVHEALETLVQVTVDNEKATALALADLDERELALNGRVTTAETKLDILIGNDANKSARQIANEELAAQLIPSGATEALNTLQEIAAWIQEHPEDAAMMNAERAVFEAVLKDYVKRDENGVLVSASTVADAIKAINDALGLTEGETTGETILDRVSGLETDVTELSGTTLTEVARLDNILGSGVTTAYTVTEALDDAQKANEGLKATIDAYTINGYALSAETINIQAKDVEVGEEISGETSYESTAKVSDVLQSISDRVHSAVQGSLHSISVASGETGLYIDDTTDANNPVVSLVLEESGEKTIKDGHAEIVRGESGLYAVMYYDGDDAE